MKIKQVRLLRHFASPERLVPWDEFLELLRGGKVGRKSLVCAYGLTNGKWLELGSLPLFQELSPIAGDEGEENRFGRVVRAPGQPLRMSRDVFNNYRSGQLIEELHGLDPIDRLGADPDVSAVARLIAQPSFDPEAIITIAFRPDVLRVDVVEGATSLWASIPTGGVAYDSAGKCLGEIPPEPFDPADARRERGSVRLCEAPVPFGSVEQFAAAARSAHSCSERVIDGVPHVICDGIGLVHKAVVGNETLEARWDSPDPEQHASQWQLVRSYRACLQCAEIALPVLAKYLGAIR